MHLNDLLLRKEELPIDTSNYHKDCRFLIPVHPALLRADISLDPKLPSIVFRQAAQEWYQDLQTIQAYIPDESVKQWHQRVFLAHEPQFKELHGQLVMEKPPHWDCYVSPSETGFCTGLSISRDAGGSLVPPERKYLALPLVNFSPEKLVAYENHQFAGLGGEGVFGYAYGRHNIDYYPGALFLRNWAILYLNAALKSIEKEVSPLNPFSKTNRNLYK